MARLVLVVLALALLSGCALLQGEYDERAHSECDQEAGSRRGACHDRVDENRRERERE